MPSKALLAAGALFCILAVVPASGDDGASPKGSTFPFEIKVDEKAGTTGSLPNRFLHKKLGMFFVLVPGGKYRIGDDNLTDSKSIEVTLSPFYVSETEVTWKQYLNNEAADRKRAIDEALAEAPKDTPPDVKLLGESFILYMHDLFPKGPGWHDEAFDAASQRYSELFASGEIKESLTAEQRAAARIFVEAFWKRFANIEAAKGDKRFDNAKFFGAERFAKSHDMSLPTEAQWEVAARLAKNRRLSVEGMFDDVLEWCTDFYAYDYFGRKVDKAGFVDPQGPRRGRLSPEQVRDETPRSSVGFVTRLIARQFKVLRGGSVSTRTYGRTDIHGGLAGDPFSRPKGIRLVFNPPATIKAPHPGLLPTGEREKD